MKKIIISLMVIFVALVGLSFVSAADVNNDVTSSSGMGGGGNDPFYATLDSGIGGGGNDPFYATLDSGIGGSGSGPYFATLESGIGGRGSGNVI